DLAASRQGGHFHRTAQGGRGEGDSQLAMQVFAVALEDAVRLDADLHVQVARRAAVHARLAIAAGADAHAVVDAGRDLDLQGLGLLDLAFAMTDVAGVRNFLAAAVAGRAGLLHAEDALLHAHRAAAVAGAAGLRRGAGLGAGTGAGIAIFPAGHADFGIEAGRRLLQADVQRVAQVRPAIHLGPTAAAASAAEDLTENVAKGIRESGPAHAAAHAAHAAHAGVG